MKLVVAIAVCCATSIAAAAPTVSDLGEPHGLPAISGDGKLVAVLHRQPIAESMEIGSAELRVIDVATDRVVERVTADPPTKTRIDAINARLARGTWTPLVAGEQVTHCPHGRERDSDLRYCELRAGDLAIHYDDTRLRVSRGAIALVDRSFRAWGHPHATTDPTDRGLEDSGLVDVWGSCDAKLIVVEVTYHLSGDDGRGSPDEEHVVRLAPCR